MSAGGRAKRNVLLLLGLGVLAYVLPVLVTVGSLYFHRDAAPMPQAQAIVVLSGPGAYGVIPVDDTRERVLRGVDLWKDGHAPLIVMSGAGGTIADTDEPDSRGMKRLAESLGVPPDAILEEDGSYSTLQNAWNTAALPEVDPEGPVILVTSRFHMPRSRASFWWVGFRDVAPAASERETPQIDVYTFREGLTWPYNIVRALIASGALRAGVDRALVWTWLE